MWVGSRMGKEDVPGSSPTRVSPGQLTQRSLVRVRKVHKKRAALIQALKVGGTRRFRVFRSWAAAACLWCARDGQEVGQGAHSKSQRGHAHTSMCTAPMHEGGDGRPYARYSGGSSSPREKSCGGMLVGHEIRSLYERFARHLRPRRPLALPAVSRQPTSALQAPVSASPRQM